MNLPYILIDTTLIGDFDNKPWLKKRRKPSWVASIYGRDAIGVSPILIDIERAVTCNRIETAMELVNAQHPQLGVSFIESERKLKDLCAHLQQFIYILTSAGTTLTLRFADCAVLPALSKVLTDDQWSSLVAPFSSWKIHGRDGKLIELPMSNLAKRSSCPLFLSDEQIMALRNEMGIDWLLANLRHMRPAPPTTYSTLDAYELADQVRRRWRSAGHQDNADLVHFAGGVFDTDGRLLQEAGLQRVLEQTDLVAIRKDLERLVSMQH
jgi:hypothetical protein